MTEGGKEGERRGEDREIAVTFIMYFLYNCSILQCFVINLLSCFTGKYSIVCIG